MAKNTITIETLVSEGFRIFDFEYPFYDENKRSLFEQNFIDHFLFDEICCYEPAKFRHLLKTKLNLIMPYWNKIYESQELELRILNNYELEETYTRTVNNTANNTSTSSNKNLFKDAPKTKIDIDKMDIVSTITKDEGTTVNTNTDKAEENYTRKTSGNIGVATDSDAIVNYWQGLRKTTEDLFEKELSILFMGVY